MLRRHAKAGVLLMALVVVAVEGYLLYAYHDRYYVHDAAASGGAPSNTVVPEETTAAENPIGTSFVHRATDGNSSGDYTYLSDPRIDGDPDAVVLVSPNPDRGSAYDHNIGVWYEPRTKKWAIFNQDRAPVPAGATFEVAIPQGPEAFVYRFASDDPSANEAYLDNPLANDKPGAVLSVTQNWNPGGGSGVYNDHPVGVRYDSGHQKWLIYNRDGAPIKDGSAFNVSVS